MMSSTTRVPSYVASFAQMVTGLALGALAAVLLLVVGFAGGVRLEGGKWIELLVVLVLGSLPMLGFGLALGYGSGPNGAPGLASILYLPMAFASGIFIPLEQRPDFMQKIGPFLPLYHYGQLGWNIVGAADEIFGVAVLWTIGWSKVLLGLAARLYSCDARKKFR